MGKCMRVNAVNSTKAANYSRSKPQQFNAELKRRILSKNIIYFAYNRGKEQIKCITSGTGLTVIEPKNVRNSPVRKCAQ